jgi:hypothetical protein
MHEIQFAEYEIIKKSLMKDLQNRCEKVVELEMQLDEVKEQYKIIARSANSRAQQRKLEFLEHNLESLNSVQKQVGSGHLFLVLTFSWSSRTATSSGRLPLPSGKYIRGTIGSLSLRLCSLLRMRSFGRGTSATKRKWPCSVRDWQRVSRKREDVNMT